MAKANVIPTSFTPAIQTVSFASVDNFDIHRLMAIIDASARLVLYDPVTPGLGFTNVSANIVTLQYPTEALSASDTLFAVYDYPDRSLGTDWSVNAPVYPNVGANWNSQGPYANYHLLGVIPKNLSRTATVVQNLSGSQVVLVIDDGTAQVGALPVNASCVCLLAGTTGAGSSGQMWTSQWFKGRVSAYAASTSAYVSMYEN